MLPWGCIGFLDYVSAFALSRLCRITITITITVTITITLYFSFPAPER